MIFLAETHLCLLDALALRCLVMSSWTSLVVGMV